MKLLLLCLPAIFWMAAIFLFSTDLFAASQTQSFVQVFFKWLWPGLSHESVEFMHFCVRKCAHVTVYAILTWFYYLPLKHKLGHSAKALLWAMILAVLYACTDEFHQSLVPSRSGSWSDVGWDALGALTMAICLLAKGTKKKSVELDDNDKLSKA